jgi:hypothetical protein
MSTPNSLLITEMGLLSQMVYKDFGITPLSKGSIIKSFTEGGQTYTLNNSYEVVDFISTSTDMQALLLKSGTQYVIAFRGTQEDADIDVDAIVGLSNINGQYADAVAFVNTMKTKYGISNSTLTLTGHSLGGILTQQVGATMHIQGYAYNPYGVDRLLTMMPNIALSALNYTALYQIMKVVGLEASEATWAKDNILNISYNDFDTFNGDILSNIVTELTSEHLGSYLPIYGKDEDYAAGHKMSVLNPAIAHYNAVLSHFTDKNYNLLTAAYVSVGDYEKTETIFNDVGVYQASGLSFNFLIDDSASSIAIQAKGDKAILYALTKLNPFAIEGNLPAYTDIDPTSYSEKYLQDRAQYLYYSIEPKKRYYYTAENIHFEDSTMPDKALSKVFSDKYILFGGEGYSTLTGGDEEDHLYGMGGADGLNGNGGDDWIEGGEGADILDGGAGKDVLIGGYTKDKVDAQSDMLKGGADFDTYISGNMDIIQDDDDGEGRVYFENKLLTGGTKKAGAGCEPSEDDGSSEYYGDGGVYRLSGNTLTFTKNGKILTIEEYQKRESGYVGITLKDNPGDGGSCPQPSGDCPKPTNPVFNFNFSLPSVIQSVINYVSGSGGEGSTYYSRGRGGGGGSSYTPPPSTPHTTPPPPAPKVECPNLPDHNSAGKGGGGGGTPPIVLDLNRNGITSISLAASTALFDYDGDGVLENTAWIENSDALLVNDVNNDGLINNASELFGNYTRNSDGSVAKSGYQALSYYDTNGDSVIDASDTRFEELKLWIDSDQDGVTDTGELKTLSEMGVTSLTLNSATPYIPTTENTNTIIQETTFTDAEGEGIMRDVLFRYENNSTNTDGVYFDMDGNGIKEKMLTWTDPNEWMVVKDVNGELEGTDTPIYTGKSNNNYYKQKIFTNNNKIDTINNCFYMFKIKVA